MPDAQTNTPFAINIITGVSARTLSELQPEEDNVRELDIHSAACWMCRADRAEWLYVGRDVNTGITTWRPNEPSIGGITVARQWIRA